MSKWTVEQVLRCADGIEHAAESRSIRRATADMLREYAAHLAAQAEWPSEEELVSMGRVIASAAGEEWDSIGEFAQGVIKDTQRAALQSLRPPVGVVSDEEWLKLADELEAFKPRGELGALHGAGMSFAYADAAKTIRAKVDASRHAPTKD